MTTIDVSAATHVARWRRRSVAATGCACGFLAIGIALLFFHAPSAMGTILVAAVFGEISIACALVANT